MPLEEIKKFGQYKYDIFTKLDLPFKKGKTLLDLGCGPGEDAAILRDAYGLKVKACDVYEHENVKDLKLDFKKGSIFDLPYKAKSFDYVFLHDVLHHINEEDQSYESHVSGLKEVEKLVKPEGVIVIVEGNRYNPLFYPHMVKMLGHDHFRQGYFIKLVKDVFPNAQFKFFEAHLYPRSWLWFWKAYEYFMERFSPRQFLAYNVAVIEM